MTANARSRRAHASPTPRSGHPPQGWRRLQRRLRPRKRVRSRMDKERNKAVVARLDELANGTGNIDDLDELCTPNFVNHALAAGAAPGIEGTRAFLRKAARSQYPAR